MVNSKYTRWSLGLTEEARENGHRESDAATRLVLAHDSTKDSIELAHSPCYQIDKSARFFCIGSCFAREIEKALLKAEVSVLSQDLQPDTHNVTQEMHPRHNSATGILTKFNSFSMNQEIQRSIDSSVSAETDFIDVGNELYWDPQLHNVPPQQLESIHRIRTMVDANYRRLREADVVILTLGLTEMWWDRETETVLNDTPYNMKEAVRNGVGRYEFKNSTYAQVKENTLKMVDNLRSLSAGVKIILTVSPVPLQRTFSKMDIVVANSYSKSLLRAVAGEITSSQDLVDYYPSYEMVVNSARQFAWRHDQRHVNPALVQQITKKFIELYIS